MMRFPVLVKTWIPAFAWMLLIFIASTDLMSTEHTSRIIEPLLRWLRPGIAPSTIAKFQLVVRKLAHVTEYAILAALLARALRSSFPIKFWQLASFVVFIAGCYAVLDEFHQSFLSSRTASTRDVMFDSVGALIGMVCYGVLIQRLKSGRRVSLTE